MKRVFTASPAHRSRGQSLVEFALVLTLFIFLMMGVFEFGRLLFSYTMMAAGVREAARYGTASGVSPRGVPRYADCEGIRAAAVRLGRFAGLKPSDVQISYDHGPGTAAYTACPPGSITLGTRIRVDIQATFTPWLLNWGGNLPLRARAERTILNAIPLDAPPGLATAPPPTPTPPPPSPTTPAPSPAPTTPAPSPTTPPPPPTPEIPPPLDPQATSTSVGQSGKCKISRFEWHYNPAWDLALQNYTLWYLINGTTASSDFHTTFTVYNFSSLALNNGSTITFDVWATFANGKESGTLEATYQCHNGTLEEVSP